MQSTRIPELDKLFFEIGTYRKSTQFNELLTFVKKFPQIAPYNAMLIHIQKPGSQYIASAFEWQRTFKRTIKIGARPLVILRPFGPVTFVFELADTEGKPLPQEIMDPFKVEGKVPNGLFTRLLNNLLCDGVSYTEVEHGTASAGLIQTSDSNRAGTIIRSQKKFKVKVLFEMVVNRIHSQETRFATIVHELAHLYCGHLGNFNCKWLSDRRDLSLNEVEFEAESVCWLICERLGINNPSAEYLSGYLDKNEFIPNISIDTVLKSVGIIESMMNNIKEPRKEITINVTDLK